MFVQYSFLFSSPAQTFPSTMYCVARGLQSTSPRLHRTVICDGHLFLFFCNTKFALFFYLLIYIFFLHFARRPSENVEKIRLRMFIFIRHIATAIQFFSRSFQTRLWTSSERKANLFIISNQLNG